MQFSQKNNVVNSQVLDQQNAEHKENPRRQEGHGVNQGCDEGSLHEVNSMHQVLDQQDAKHEGHGVSQRCDENSTRVHCDRSMKRAQYT